MTRPSPELFGLIDATSNEGAAPALPCAACALARGGRTLLTTSATGTRANTTTAAKRPDEVRRLFDSVFIGVLSWNRRIIRLDTRPGVTVCLPGERDRFPRGGHRAPRRSSVPAGRALSPSAP